MLSKAEELGLEVSLGRLVDVYSYQGEPIIVIVYEGTVPAGSRPEPSREALEVKAFLPDEIPWEELGFSSTEEALRAALSEGEGQL